MEAGSCALRGLLRFASLHMHTAWSLRHHLVSLQLGRLFGIIPFNRLVGFCALCLS